MKLLKKLFYGICILLMLLCGIILLCALQPSLTQSIAAVLYGDTNSAGEADDVILPVIDVEGENNTGSLDGTEEEMGTSQSSDDRDTAAIDSGLSASENGYDAPDVDSLQLPETVADRTGYQPVQEQAQEVAGEEADSLLSRLSTGDTGDSLSFDSTIYPYYGMLDTRTQSLYRQIYANANSLQRNFAPAVAININQLKNAFEAVCNDHPELFWLETGYSCKYRSDGSCVEITLEFNRLASDLGNAKTNFQTQAQNLLGGAQSLSSDYEKEKYIHDALLTRVEYNTSSELNQSAYSALVNGETVCAGYARAFQYLMQQLGIPCYYCAGYSGENHAWNIIRLQGDYYNVDTTWDDTNPATYDYFNGTDADYARTHVRQGLSVYLPACNGTVLRGLEGGQPDSVAGITTGNVDNTEPESGTWEAEENTETPTPTPLPGPLTWTSSDNGEETGENLADLEAAGIDSEDVVTTLENYYADCLKQMTEAGSGQHQFTNVIPASLWSSVERAYSDGSYQTGYVNGALEKLGMTDFAIQLQARGIGKNNYYVLYHNVSSWK